jgi:hypothetical protein
MGYVYSVTIIINRCKLQGEPHPYCKSPKKFFAKPAPKEERPYQRS